MSFILFAFVALLAIFAPIAQAASVRLTSGPLVACRFAKLRFEDVQAPVTVTITDSVSGTSEEMSLRSGSGVGWFVSIQSPFTVFIDNRCSCWNFPIFTGRACPRFERHYLYQG